MSSIVADGTLRLEGGPTLHQLVLGALHYGWEQVAADYDLDAGAIVVRGFMADLLTVSGPLAELLVALADASVTYSNLCYDYYAHEDDNFPEMWRLEESAGPLVNALAYTLARMSDRRTVAEWEDNR